MTAPGDRLRSKLAKDLATALSDLAADDHEASKDRAHDKGVHLAEAWEQEAAEVLREHLSHWLDHPDVDDELREQLRKLTEPTHFVQLAAVVPALIALAYVLGSAAMAGPASRLTTLSMRNFGDVPWPVDPFIAAAVRGQVTQEQVEKQARDQGMDPTYVNELMLAAEQMPALGSVIELVRRGFVGRGAVSQVARRLGMPDNWAEQMPNLIVEPVPWSQALNAELQGVLDAGQVKAILEQNGIDPANHDWLYEANGMPPPIEQLIQLWRRGIATSDDVYTALIEGPVKNKWIPLIMQMRDRVPPQETVIALTRRGVFDRAEGIDMLIKNGFSPDLATKMIAYADNLDDGGVREATKSEVLTAYQLHLIDETTARDMLRRIKFTDEHIDMVLALLDAQRERRMLDASLTKLRTLYVGWRIGEGELQTSMDRLGVPPDMRDELLQVWTIERTTATRGLTPAQIIKAGKAELITQDQVMDRLRGLGYSDDDAKILVEIAPG